ncbi:MAG TPA: isopenicillin N synthase family oxygenase [Gammaproteobacteria bacterium]|nr:isopenicillin N synthase family oxygenase [Gammaproteobacteria bacterium]
MPLPFSVLSLNLWKEDPKEFATQMGRNFENSGFCGITEHSINEELINEVLQIFKRFFALPEQEKMQYFETNLGGARGYTPIKVETPKGGYEADIKEFWQTGRSLPKDHEFRKWMPSNKWATEIPRFKEKVHKLFEQFDLVGKALLKSVAIYLQIDENYFEEVANEGNSVMRTIHYPPVRQNEKGERSGAHEDINLITLLIGGHQPGLEIRSKKKEWLPVNFDPEVLICNIGDMLQRFTNHKLVSTTHRVVTPEESSKNTSRYSIPFFVHPNPNWVIETLDSCCSEDNPKKYQEAILSEDFLQERLKEIKLI